MSSSLNDPFNVLTLANSIGTLGLAYWSFVSIKGLTKSVDEMNEQLKKLTVDSERKTLETGAIQTNLHRIGNDLKSLLASMEDFDAEVVLEKISTLEEEAKAQNATFKPYRAKRNRNKHKVKSTGKGKKRKQESSSEESSEEEESSDDDLVMKSSKDKSKSKGKK